MVDIEWSPEQIAQAIQDDIDGYENLKEKLKSASGDEAKRIELQKFDRWTQIKELKRELIEKGRDDLWEQFIDWEKKLS